MILVFETKSLIILIFFYFLISRVSSIFALLWCLVIFETKIDSFVKRLHLDTNRPDTDQIIDKKLIALPKDFDPNQPDPAQSNSAQPDPAQPDPAQLDRAQPDPAQPDPRAAPLNERANPPFKQTNEFVEFELDWIRLD